MRTPDYELTLEGCSPAAVDASLRERLHCPWTATLTLGKTAASEAAGVAPETLALEWLGKLGTLTLRSDLVLESASAGARTLSGVVTGTHLTPEGVVVEFASRLKVLEHGQDHRVFLDLTEVEIAKKLLEEWGFEVEDRTSRVMPKRRQCVQAGESVLGFVSRILSEAGVVYQCASDGGEGVVFLDGPDQFSLDSNPVLLARESGLRTDDRVITDARLRLRRRTETVLLNDWNYEAPSADLASRAGEAGALLEEYRYHDDYRTPDEGKQLATLRLEALRRDARVLTLTTHCRDLAVGSVIEVEGDEPAVIGQWLVVAQEWESSRGEVDADSLAPFTACLQAVKANDGYRPVVMDAPQVGFTRSVVTGGDGDEIHPDDQLRVRLRHHVDRRGATGTPDAGSAPSDQDSSWVRSTQPLMSGSMLIPRVGWEVFCTHWGRSGDEPLVLGRLVNAEFPPPVKLPEERLTTVFGTRSTTTGGSAGGGAARSSAGGGKGGATKGGGGNSIAFDDTPGKEGMRFKAGSRLHELVGNDRKSSVKGTLTMDVGGNRKVGTGMVYNNTISGSQDYTVGTRKVSVAANKTITAGGESISVGGARIWQVGGKQGVNCSSYTRAIGGAKAEAAIGGESRKVKGANVTLVGGALGQVCATNGVSVAGANTEVVAGPKVINTGAYGLKVTGPLTELYGARAIKGAGVDLEAAGGLSIKAGASTFKGANVVFKAGAITIKAGGATISIGPGNVTIDAVFDTSGGGDNSSNQDYG
ncbi:MAG: type VI secretion system Vgr family protein [Polyangiaceae bacterium]